jgi:hypothetical protein
LHRYFAALKLASGGKLAGSESATIYRCQNALLIPPLRALQGCEMDELNGLWSFEFFTAGVSRSSGSIVFTPQAKIRGADSQFLWTGSYQLQGAEIWVHLEAATRSGGFANRKVSGRDHKTFTLGRLVGPAPIAPIGIGTSFSVTDSADTRLKIVFAKVP